MSLVLPGVELVRANALRLERQLINDDLPTLLFPATAS